MIGIAIAIMTGITEMVAGMIGTIGAGIARFTVTRVSRGQIGATRTRIEID